LDSSLEFSILQNIKEPNFRYGSITWGSVHKSSKNPVAWISSQNLDFLLKWTHSPKISIMNVPWTKYK